MSEAFKFKAKKDITLRENSAKGYEKVFNAQSTEGGIEAEKNTAEMSNQESGRTIKDWISEFWLLIVTGTIAAFIASVLYAKFAEPMSPERIQTTPSQMQQKTSTR